MSLPRSKCYNPWYSYAILQRVKNVTHIYQHIYPSNKLINNQVEDTIDHTTEKKRI